MKEFNKIYVVFFASDQYGDWDSYPEGYFSSKEKAEEFIRNHEINFEYDEEYGWVYVDKYYEIQASIEEFNVDEGL